MAKITVKGNITSEPGLKFTPNAKPYLKFGVADNHSKKDAQGAWQDDGVTFYNVTSFDRNVEALIDQIKVGTTVLVSGDLRKSDYEKDGVARTSLEIIADSITLVVRSAKIAKENVSQDPWANSEAPF